MWWSKSIGHVTAGVLGDPLVSGWSPELPHAERVLQLKVMFFTKFSDWFHYLPKFKEKCDHPATILLSDILVKWKIRKGRYLATSSTSIKFF